MACFSFILITFAKILGDKWVNKDWRFVKFLKSVVRMLNDIPLRGD